MKNNAKDKAGACRAGFGRATINPDPGVGLAGYLNPRPNTGVLDDLHVKVFLVESGGAVAGMASYDLCYLDESLIADIRAALKAEGIPCAETIALAATHTHTGPDVGGIFYTEPASAPYLRRLIARTVAAAKEALADLAPAEFAAGGVEENPFAFNRRYWMKDGTVVTNPGKLNPDIVRPEGPVDKQIGLLAVRRNGALAGLVANVCNHTDTTGGDQVSADWPGHMERAIQRHVGAEIPVLTLIAPAGNINHFDVTAPGAQTSYAEAQRIGGGYAEIICRALDALQPIRPDPVRVHTLPVTIVFRDVPQHQLDQARELLKGEKEEAAGDVTSEDLARGSAVAARFFAEQLLEYAAWAKGPGRDFTLAALKFSDELAVVFLPGEPFTEVGLAIKQESPFKRTFVAELSNGKCGYVPMKECFAHGGYEILPVRGGGPREDTCNLLIAGAGALLGDTA